MAKVLEQIGKHKETNAAFKESAVYKAAVSEISLFRALSLRELGETVDTDRVLHEMLAEGEDKIQNKDLRGYCGVGSPTPMPFELNIERQNLTDGYVLYAYALLGLGRVTEADAPFWRLLKPSRMISRFTLIIPFARPLFAN